MWKKRNGAVEGLRQVWGTEFYAKTLGKDFTPRNLHEG
jgi:hypothetical protein